MAVQWKEWFESNFKEYKCFISVSKTEDYELEDNYLQFKNLEPLSKYNSQIKAILFCVGRCREGSDIDYLDCGIYLDPVKNRSTTVAIQSGGRIMRLDKYNLKEYAYVIEGYLSNSENVSECFANQVLSYYTKLLQISEDNADYINKLSKLLENTNFDESNKIIRLKVDNESKHDCILDIDIKMTEIDWKKTKLIVEKSVKEQIKRKENSGIDNDPNIKLIKETNFTNSKINIVKINNKVFSDKHTWRKTIEIVYNEINDIDKIKLINNRIYKGNNKLEKGYKYTPSLDISFQNKNATDSILEIIKQCLSNNMHFYIEIKLENDSVIVLENKFD
jgi:hypothetical protein